MADYNMGSIGCLIVVIAMSNRANADLHIVGESLGWTIPSIGSFAYEAWAATQNFEIGDNVVFKWTTTHDVTEVSKADYNNCTKTNPIGAIQRSSPATITLDTNTSRYFICTVSNHCELGQKVAITIGSNSASSLTIGAFSATLMSIIITHLLNSNM